MLTIDQALHQLQQAGETFLQNRISSELEHWETCLLNKALGRILAKDVVADINVPPCDNSAMDGYAINLQHLLDNKVNRDASLNAIPISQRITAGDQPGPLELGTAARIFTGASIPQGADCVIMQENCRVDDDQLSIIELPKVGANIRPLGQDIQSGQIVIRAGQRLRAQELGLCASLGITHVDVYQPLKIALLVSGDELVQPGQPLPAGKIYDSNSTLLHCLLALPCFDLCHHQVVADDFDLTQDAIRHASNKADLLITSGGASVGEEDYMAAAIKQMGQLDLWKVAIKPGKPIMFGQISSANKTVPMIGLPGNPMSLFVTLLMVVKPYLLQCAGQQSVNKNPQVLLDGDWGRANFSKKAERRDVFLRAKRTDAGIELHPNQSSGVLSSACWGDILVHQPAGEAVEKDQLVRVLSYGELSL